MATPTITIAQTHTHPSANSGGSANVGGGCEPTLSSHHRLRASVKTGSVRNIIKNLTSLSSPSNNTNNGNNAAGLELNISSSLSSMPGLSPSTASSTSTAAAANNQRNNSEKAGKASDEVSPVRKHIIEEFNDDSVYSIQLKKITYSINSPKPTANSNLVTKCDQVNHRSAATSQRDNAHKQQSNEDNQQSLQWETRQLRTIKGATLEHLVKYVLFMTPAQRRLRYSHKSHNASKCPSHGHSTESSSSLAGSSKRHSRTATNNNNSKDISTSSPSQDTRHDSQTNNSHSNKKHNSDDASLPDNCDHEDDDEDDEDPRYIEERNNVAHAMHVLFATYRQFAYPWTLFEHIIKQRALASSKQFNFILYYWLNNYPEDFWTSHEQQHSQSNLNNSHQNAMANARESPQRSSSRNSVTKTTPMSIATIHSNGSSSSSSVGHLGESLETSEDGSSIYSEYTISSSNSNSSASALFGPDSHSSLITSPLTLADQLIAMRQIDEDVKKHCLHLLDMKKDAHSHGRSFTQLYSSPSFGSASSGSSSSSSQRSIQKTSSILDLDCKFIAQQLTAIDLENFLTLKPYTLLSNVRSKTKIETMIRNFNLLSRHVIVTILQSPTPHLVTQHWIDVAQQLRKMRNFNSLKATIAGLTNESIHRLKSCIWNKLSKSTLLAFQSLSSVVDDVNNQTLLRHTQLVIEGTSKVALDESFGTIPYLGTFLTDITMINTRYSNHIKTTSTSGNDPSVTGQNCGPEKKLINFEKCAKQYEILMQMQLLQKNAIAALQQQQQQNYHLGPIYSLNHYLSLRSQTVPSIPRVARIFRNWFQLAETDMLNDKECYQISLNIEPSLNKAKAPK